MQPTPNEGTSDRPLVVDLSEADIPLPHLSKPLGFGNKNDGCYTME